MIQKIKNWFKSESETNLEENKNAIMNLLTSSNFNSLSVPQQIELFKMVESEFANHLAKQNLEAEIVIEAVDKFSRCKFERPVRTNPNIKL